MLALSAGTIGIPGVFLVQVGARTDAGGESVVAKQPQLAAAPEAGEYPEVASAPEPPIPPVTAPLDFAVETTPVTASAEPSTPAAPAAPVEAKASAPKAEGGLDLATIDAPAPSLEERSQSKPERQTAANSVPTEDLPWDKIEPVPLSRLGPPNAAAPETATASVAAPLPASDSQAWVKSKAAALAGGVDDRGRPLYRFELWVEPPAEVRQKLVSVAYDFGTSSAEAQESKEQGTGFRVRYGSLACVDKITLTLKFNDGQSQQIAVDGCKLPG